MRSSPALPPQAEDALDAEAPRPRGRAGVPAPPAATDPWHGAVDVAREHVGLDPVARDVLGIRGAEDRVEEAEDSLRALSVPESGVGPAQPGGGVGVLAAVLPDSRRVGPDVPGIVPRGVERRREQEHEPVGLANELLVGCAHRARVPGSPRRPRRASPVARARARPRTARSSRSDTRALSRSRRASRRHEMHAGTRLRPTRTRRSCRAGTRRDSATWRPARSRSRASQSDAKRSIVAHKNQPNHTLSPRPSAPTRFIPSFQSPSPMRGRP